MNALISVIVPVYNTELYLDRCINSILEQSYKNLEIILVDDGSTDSSSKKCDEYACLDSRIRVIHKMNGGLSSARNAGLDICSGDFIGFVDSDDCINSTMYEKLLSLCKDTKTIGTIGMQQIKMDGSIGNSIVWEDELVSRDYLLRNILCHKDGGSVCSRLFPRRIIGNHRFDETKLNEDVLFMVSIVAKANYAAYTSSVGYYYLYREGSISRHFGKAVHDMIGNSIEIRKYVEDTFPSLSMEAKRFEIFQHMSFLLCCPVDYDRKSDLLYGEVVKYIRRNVISGVKNPYLTCKDKWKLLGVFVCPKGMARLIEIKSKGVNI